MTWDDGLTELQYELANLYFRDERIRSVAVEAGIPHEVLDLDDAPITDWYNVLREAANRGMVADLVTIASSEYPMQADKLTAALQKHQQGVGAFSSVLAEFNRALSANLRQVLAGVLVAVITSWILTGTGGTFFRREFVLLLQFAVLLLTPFIVRAVFTRLRLAAGIPTLLLVSVLFVLAEAALFSEIVGGIRHNRGKGEITGTLMLETLTPVESYSVDPAVFSGTLKSTSNNKVTVKGGARGAIVTRLQPLAYVLLDVEWDAKDPWFHRNYAGTVLFIYQFRCYDGVMDLDLLNTSASFQPGRDLRSWLVGFAQIPYLGDRDTNIEGAVAGLVRDTLQERMPECTPA